MKILLGTTNPSKVRRFQELLQDYEVEFLTPACFSSQGQPAETGGTPVENAVQKAAFYSQFADRVLCEDSGLYFRDLAMDDPRQPGLHIRSPQGKRLEDEEMIAYYAGLAGSLGGKALCGYVDGLAVWNRGVVHTFLDDRENEGFYLVSQVHPNRHPGWPLDSISIDRHTGRYFVDDSPDVTLNDLVIQASGYRQRLIEFLVEAFGLERKG